MSLLSPTLQAFWAVARKGTVQEASRFLGLTQTGVTQRIRSLESQLKTTLFTRSRKGMRLTKDGEELLHYVLATSKVEGMTLSRIQKAGEIENRTVSLVGPSSILRSRLIPQFLKAQSRFKNLKYHFDLSDTETNSEKLKSGAFDFAILEHHDVTKEMDSKILKPERYKIFVAASWKRRAFLEILKTESIIDFNPHDKMTLNYLEKYKLKTVALTARHFANNTDALATMISEGLGFSVLSEEFAKPLVKSGQLFDIQPERHFDYKVALAWYYRPEVPEYMKTLIQLAN